MSRLQLIAFVAFAAPAAALAQAPSQLVVNVSSFSYAPKPIHLVAGRPVTIAFVNRSREGHDFTARAFFQRARIISGAAPDGRIDLRGNETKAITLVPARGTYRVHCSRFLHKQMGMSDLIVVN